MILTEGLSCSLPPPLARSPSPITVLVMLGSCSRLGQGRVGDPHCTPPHPAHNRGGPGGNQFALGTFQDNFVKRANIAWPAAPAAAPHTASPAPPPPSPLAQLALGNWLPCPVLFALEPELSLAAWQDVPSSGSGRQSGGQYGVFCETLKVPSPTRSSWQSLQPRSQLCWTWVLPQRKLDGLRVDGDEGWGGLVFRL